MERALRGDRPQRHERRVTTPAPAPSPTPPAPHRTRGSNAHATHPTPSPSPPSSGSPPSCSAPAAGRPPPCPRRRPPRWPPLRAHGRRGAVRRGRPALTGQERRDRLIELAAEEDGLNLYTSMTADVADAVTEAFSDEFDIDVSVYRAGSETVLQRILQEQDAGFPGNDIVETNSTELVALEAEEVLATYEGERRDLVPDVGKSDTWTATRFNLFAPSWNTELISGDMVPTSWEDLADPKYDEPAEHGAGRLRLVPHALQLLARRGQDRGGGRPAVRGHGRRLQDRPRPHRPGRAHERR